MMIAPAIASSTEMTNRLRALSRFVVDNADALDRLLQAALSRDHSDHGVDERDRADVRDTLNGDPDAYARVVQRYQQELAARLRRFSRDRLVLEELVQETFVQGYMSLSKYRFEGPLLAWLHAIGVRAGYRHWRSSRSGPAAAGLDEVAAHDRRDGPAELERVLEQLSARDRIVLTLLYLEDRNVRQTAALLGWSQTMVKVQAYRARRRLRRIMESVLPE